MATARAASEVKKASYPIIRAPAWWTLRKQFRQRMPGVVDAKYLASVLNYKIESAKTLIQPLKRLGLIDNEGKPAQRAVRWRDDEEYPSVCEEIRQDVYPSGLLDTFPGPELPRAKIERWFANDTGAGESASAGYAALYFLLTEADLSKQDSSIAPKGPKQPKAPTAITKAKSLTTRTSHSTKGATGAETNVTVDDETPQHDHHRSNPVRMVRGLESAIHINIQVHIASDASADQIEQIFASMSKHLWRQGEVSG